jgi:hypothetical protein
MVTVGKVKKKIPAHKTICFVFFNNQDCSPVGLCLLDQITKGQQVFCYVVCFIIIKRQ